MVYYYSRNLSLQCKRGGLYDISKTSTSILKIIDLINPVDEWAEISFSAHQKAKNEHCETLKELVHKLNFGH